MNSAMKIKQELLSRRRSKQLEKAQEKENPWITRPKPQPNAKLRMFTLPYAGGAPAVFRSWPDHFAPNIEVCPIHLPGRENRMMEPMPDTFYFLIDNLMKAIRPYLDMPYVFYGHCMGSLISFELLRQLRNQNEPQPQHFYVGAHFAPSLLGTDNVPTSHLRHLSLDEFFKIAEGLGGTEEAVLKDPATGALIIPTLKGDYVCYGDFAYRPEKPFDFPITVFTGNHDNLVKAEEAQNWKEETTAPTRFDTIDGDHFFCITKPRELLGKLEIELGKVLDELN